VAQSADLHPAQMRYDVPLRDVPGCLTFVIQGHLPDPINGLYLVGARSMVDRSGPSRPVGPITPLELMALPHAPTNDVNERRQRW